MLKYNTHFMIKEVYGLTFDFDLNERFMQIYRWSSHNLLTMLILFLIIKNDTFSCKFVAVINRLNAIFQLAIWNCSKTIFGWKGHILYTPSRLGRIIHDTRQTMTVILIWFLSINLSFWLDIRIVHRLVWVATYLYYEITN